MDKILQRSPHDEVPSMGQLVRFGGFKIPTWKASRFNVRATTEDGRLILWNSYSGSISVFQADQKAAVLDVLRGVTGKREGIVGYLAERGFLVPEGTDELRRVQYRFGQNHYQTDNLELILLASEDCNFRCTYCYEDFARGTMRPEVRSGVKKLVESRLPQLRRLHILWFGGEPLYGMEAIEDLAPFFVEGSDRHSLTYISHMTTNGYLLTPPVVDKLLAWRIADFQITLDGLAEQHDSNRPTRDGGATFETIYANLEAMRRRDDPFRVNLRINFDRGNHPHLGKLLEKLERSFAGDPRFDVRFHAVGPWGGPNDAELDVCDRDESRRIGRKLRDAARRHGLEVGGTLKDVTGPGSQNCYAARPFSFVVGADGQVMKCTVTLDKDERNVVGQLTADGTLELDDDKMALWTEPAFETDAQCRRCVLVPTCQGIRCPRVRIEKGRRPCPHMRRELKSQLLEVMGGSEQPGESPSGAAPEVATGSAMKGARHSQATTTAAPSEETQEMSNPRTVDRAEQTAGQQQAWIRDYLRNLDADPDAVRSAIDGLSAQDLTSLGYNAFYMNLLAIFGERWTPQEVGEAAERATRAKLWHGWRYYSYFRRCGLDGASSSPFLAGLDADAVREVAADRGVVICSFHLGDYRHLPSDLALAGIPLTVALDSDAYAQQLVAHRGTADERLRELAHFANVEDSRGTLQLAKRLAGGGVIFAYVDGNTGQDGALGSQARTVIDFCGFPVQVKNGMARLAARFGAPMLPVLAPRLEHGGRWVLGPVIRPSGKLKGEAQEGFVADAMQRLYAFFEEHVLRHPDQWETCCFFHRWRSLAAPVPALTAEQGADALRADLTAGKVVHMNPRRIAVIRRDGACVWTDVKTLKAYKAPAAVPALLDRLSPGGSGVDQVWVDERLAEPWIEDQVITYLGYLNARDALRSEQPTFSRVD